MISIVRPTQPPTRLVSKGPAAIDAFCAEFDRSPQEFLDGSKSFEYDSTIYGHETVKNALKSAQHDKCCFCESHVTAVAHGDVEHFRPKAGYQQAATDKLSRPGYYWLAYEWTNLLFACQICNQSGKRNLFPLSNATRRAKSHGDDVSRERPMLIDPATEDPTRLIGFREEVAYAIRGNRRAKATIDDILRLNRDELCERRREKLRLFTLAARMVRAAKNDGKDVADHEAELRSMCDPTREYSSMLTAALKVHLPT